MYFLPYEILIFSLDPPQTQPIQSQIHSTKAKSAPHRANSIHSFLKIRESASNLMPRRKGYVHVERRNVTILIFRKEERKPTKHNHRQGHPQSNSLQSLYPANTASLKIRRCRKGDIRRTTSVSRKWEKEMNFLTKVICFSRVPGSGAERCEGRLMVKYCMISRPVAAGNFCEMTKKEKKFR